MVHYRVLRAVALLFLPLSLAQTTNFGQELTQAELEVQGAISPPCETNQYCERLVTDVIPRCQKLQGDPGCWCGNHDPLHYCAICMSNPTNNETTADQTAAALDGHTKFHTLCNAFEAALNASISASAGPSSTASGIATGAASSNSGSSKAPIGAIVGGSVGGAVALIVAAVLIMLWLRRRKRSRVAPSSVSLFSEGAVSSQARPYSGYGHPQSAFGHHDGQYGGPPPESAFVPGYGPASVPYQTSGMRSPGLNSVSDGSYKKHPEPMTPAPGY